MHDPRDQHEGNRDCEVWPAARYGQEMRVKGFRAIARLAANHQKTLMKPCSPAILQKSDEVAVNGVCHRLEPIVSSEFLIDVVEMIAQRLRTDTEPLGDMWSILSRRKHP